MSENEIHGTLNCACNEAWRQRGRDVSLHQEWPCTESDAWKRLIDLIEDAAVREVEEWSPGSLMAPEDWRTIVTLPPQIAKLKSVRRLNLYGSPLVRIPPKIGVIGSV